MGNASLPVRETLMDKAKFLYHDKLVCDISAPQRLRFFHKGGLLNPVRSEHGLVELSGGI